MWVYCATYKHDLFFLLWCGGGEAFSWTSTSSRSIKTRKELHLNGKRFRGYQQKRKWRMGEKKWEIEHWNFFILFCFRFTVYNEEHIFSSIFTFAFKNNQLNSRNEKIDYNERSGLRETDFFPRTNIGAYFCINRGHCVFIINFNRRKRPARKHSNKRNLIPNRLFKSQNTMINMISNTWRLTTFYCFSIWHNWLTLTALLKPWTMGHKTFLRRFINAHVISSNPHPEEIWRDCDSRVETICVRKKMKIAFKW